jgi:SAM-dependent methyltransferase
MTLGIDYNSDAIAYAREKYQRDNLSFRVLDVAGLSGISERFEVVCAFQVIEHIEEADDFVRAVKARMTKGGVFIVSTPNRLDASPHSTAPCNKYHVREYLCGEFRQFLRGHFREVALWGLKRTKRLSFFRHLKKSGICRALPPRVNPVERYFSRVTCDAFTITRDAVDASLDFIAVCND